MHIESREKVIELISDLNLWTPNSKQQRLPWYSFLETRLKLQLKTDKYSHSNKQKVPIFAIWPEQNKHKFLPSHCSSPHISCYVKNAISYLRGWRFLWFAEHLQQRAYAWRPFRNWEKASLEDLRNLYLSFSCGLWRLWIRQRESEWIETRIRVFENINSNQKQAARTGQGIMKLLSCFTTENLDV